MKFSILTIIECGRIFVAGQIGLIASSMEMPRRETEDEQIIDEAELCLRHSVAIVKASYLKASSNLRIPAFTAHHNASIVPSHVAVIENEMFAFTKAICYTVNSKKTNEIIKNVWKSGGWSDSMYRPPLLLARICGLPRNAKLEFEVQAVTYSDIVQSIRDEDDDISNPHPRVSISTIGKETFYIALLILICKHRDNTWRWGEK